MAGSTLPIAAATPLRGVRTPAARVVAAALTVFTLDGLYVVTIFAGLLHRATAERIFQGIAFAVVGPPAVVGGWRTAALGVFLHFCVSLGWSVVWALAYESSSTLRRTVASSPAAVMVGAGYGAVVWIAMQLVGLPLTQAKPGPLFTPGGMLVLLAHLVVVGPPIVLIVRRTRARTSSAVATAPRAVGAPAPR